MDYKVNRLDSNECFRESIEAALLHIFESDNSGGGSSIANNVLAESDLQLLLSLPPSHISLECNLTLIF